MVKFSGHHVVWPHNYAHANPSCVEQPFGKVIGHPDAAMRCGISRERATVERDARPSEALHVGHVSVVVHVGVVLCFLLENSEDTGWRLALPLPARHWRSHDPAFGVVDSDLLVTQRNDRHNWLIDGAQLNQLFLPEACSIRKIVRCHQSGQAGKRKTSNAQSSQLMLEVEDVRFHLRVV